MKAGWDAKRLDQLCTVFTDGDWIESKDQSPFGVRLVQTGNIGNGEFKDRSEKARYISDTTFDRLRCTELRAGDCLVSRLPDPVGRACLIPELPEKAITAVDCTIIRFEASKILPTFFVYFSQSAAYAGQVERLTGGATRQRISRKNLGQVVIPLPPLEEQRRIVAVLDEAFAAIATATANAEKNLANVQRVLDGWLRDAMEPCAEGVWPSVQLGILTTKIGSGATPRGGKDSYLSEGIPLIRSLNVHDRRFRPDQLAFLDESQAKQLSNVTLQSQDVLLNITGASVARCCLLPDDLAGGRVNQHVSIIRTKHDVLIPKFLELLLTSPTYKDRLLGVGNQGGATRQAITKAEIQGFEIALPPIETQRAIIDQFKSVESDILAAKNIFSRKAELLAALKQSLLHRAFTGELIAAMPETIAA